MIVDLPDSTIDEVNRRLIIERETGGAVALGRVLTLIIDSGEQDPEAAIDAANAASHENPCRVIVTTEYHAPARGLNAEIRLGGDAGASEVIVLRHPAGQREHVDSLALPLLLPDTPIFAWWPGHAPENPSAHPIGRLARRRITDSKRCSDGAKTLRRLAKHYKPGDTDLAWTRTSLWRGLAAASLDLPPFDPVTSVTVFGQTGHPSIDLIQAWFHLKLGVPVTTSRIDGAPAITGVRLERESGPIIFDRPDGLTAKLSQPGQPEHSIPLPIRPLSECIAEELRRLDADEVYGEVLEEFGNE